MNSHSHALIAMAAPLISLAAALPQHYITRPITTDVNLPLNDQHEVNLNLASLNETDKNASTTFPMESKVDAGQCATHNDFTYYSERPLPGAEADSILIEECDPSNPNQIRLAYIANKSFKGKLSPTSILIGCTSTSPKSFTARQDGAFNKVTPGVYTNFVRRALAQPTGMRTTLVKNPNAAAAIKKGNKKRSEEDSDQVLVIRWESRSDIDQYSDGYHTCLSSSSSACRIVMTKQVCPELEKVLKASLPVIKTGNSTTLKKRFACTPDGLKGIKCPDRPVGGSFQFGRDVIMIKRSVPGELEHVNGKEKIIDSKYNTNQLKSESKEKEHNEFMRRWLQGDEHPRPFMTRSEEPLRKRAMGVEEFHQNVRGDSLRVGNELHGKRQGGDEGDMHLSTRSHSQHYHDEDGSCDSFSDLHDPRCVNRNRYAGLQQKRDLKGKEDEINQVQMVKRYIDSNDDDNYSDCTDLSDQNRVECKNARFHGVRYIKRSQQDGLNKRSMDTAHKDADAGEMQKRWHNSDKDSVESYGSRNSNSGRGKYRQRAIDTTADQAIIKRSTGEDGEKDLLDKRSHYSRKSGRSRHSWNRRNLADDGEDALEKRSRHSGRSHRSWHRREMQGEDHDGMEKRSHHSGRSRRSWHRRDLQGEVKDDAIEKRSQYSGRSRSSGNGNGNRYQGRNDSRSSGNRSRHSRRAVNVEVDVGMLGKRDLLAIRDLYDDGMTVRSALSEHGDIFERGQDSYTDILGKREETSKDEDLSKRLVVGRETDEGFNKRDLATSVWKMTVAPLLKRREAVSSVTIFKRDII